MKPGTASRLLVIVLPAIIAGCSIVPESTPVRLLDPRPESGSAAGGSPASWALNVARPESDPMRDSNRVLVRTGPGQLKVHANARWVAAAPDLLRTLLVRRMRDCELLAGVGGDLPGAERTLSIDLRRFELAERDDGSLLAEIGLEARLYDSRSAGLIARRLFEARESIPSAQPDAITAGFEAGLSELLVELADWVVENGAPD